jgi:hypothetical protein
MGVYGENSCSESKGDKSIIYTFMYFIAIITLLIVGSLYEMEIIPRKNEYTEKSVWWYGGIGALIVCLVMIIQMIFRKSNKTRTESKYATYFWYFSHILCYFTLAFVSPGQWPFWLAIGITWELFECYLSCGLIKKGYPITCSGMYDITANLAGIAIAMWIHSEIQVPELLKK